MDYTPYETSAVLGAGRRAPLSKIASGKGNVKRLPRDFHLSNAYPNPFNPETKFEYALPKPSKVKISIYNLRGQLVTTLVDRNVSAGYHDEMWKGVDKFGNQAASGIYILHFTADDGIKVRREARKLALIK